ncbi:exopolysaccharide biosynthesis protein [Sulfitobacter sp. HNIBRBA2951]|uniref:exopolysaccharide biosynthesis protein n=1 Tax=Sulfitobacter aquimarinus TaxID=3158557 RepID=UPI0032DFD924
MSSRTANLTGMLEQIENAEGSSQISVGEIVGLVGSVSFAPLLIVPALALVTPLSGIPLFSSTMGIIIFLVSAQMIVRRESLWLPEWLLDLQTSRSRVHGMFERIRPFVEWLDRRTHSRFTVLTHRPLVLIPQGLCVLSGAVLPLLELVPFSSSLIGVSIALLGIGIFARDGLLLMLALVPYTLIAALVLRVI